jgi:predicted permease
MLLILNKLKVWLLAIFLRRKAEAELDEELRYHLEKEIERHIAGGMSPQEARMTALRGFGGFEQKKEECRDARGLRLIEDFWQDLRYGARMLRSHRGFTAVAVLSLALGIGANTAIFSLMDAVLFKLLPVKNPEQLVFLERAGGRAGGKGGSGLSYTFFEQLRAQHEILAGICTFLGNPRINVVVDGQAEVADAQRVSGSFFAVLGINALLGRTITEGDDKVPGGHPVVVISHRYWQQRFARDPAIVGKQITVNNHPFTIIGVTPPEFFGVTVGEAPDLWAPIMMDAQLRPGRSIGGSFNYPVGFVLARLKAEVTEQQARAVLTGIFQQSLADASGSQLSWERHQGLRQQSITLIPASQGLSSLRAQFSEPLRILMVVVGVILLIACANVANLLLARATTRQKEIAVRLALGAGRARLIRQLLTESMLLASLGGALGLLFAGWGNGFLLALVGSGRNPVFLNLTLDLRVLGFAASVSLLAGILFGLAPAWRATRVDLTPTLKDSTRIVGSGARMGLGKTLVIAQVALSLFLLIGAGLFVRSLEKLKNLDAGFKQENVLLVSTDPQLIGYRGRQIAELYQRVLEGIKAVPGVTSASLLDAGLLSGSSSFSSVKIQGRVSRPEDNYLLQDGQRVGPNAPFICFVGPDFFETVGMTILRGRGLTAQDNENSPKVAVINETFARYYFGAEDPIGRRFGRFRNDGEIEIVGLVKDAKYASLREQSLRTYYMPYLQEANTWGGITFQIRTAAEPTSLITAVRQAMREVDANLPLFNIKSLATQVDETLVQERLIGTVASFFGLLSLLLTCIGLYGIMAYAVSQRTHELGIRMALGARHSTVLWMVLRQGMKLVLLGVGLGLAVSRAGTGIVASQLFDVTPTDSVTFTVVPLLLLIVALLACFVPARRATKVDPLVALRSE